jgi:hypothetical protein
VSWGAVRWYDDMMIMTNKTDDSNNNNNNNNNNLSSDVELLLSSSLPLWNEELAAEFAAAEKRKMHATAQKQHRHLG